MNKNFWFKHDKSLADNDTLYYAMQKYKADAYAAYCISLEKLLANDGVMNYDILEMICKKYRIKKDAFAYIIKKSGLFTYNDTDNTVTSQFILDTISAQKAKSLTNSEVAKKRWENSNANALQTHSERIANVVQTHSERIANAMPVDIDIDIDIDKSKEDKSISEREKKDVASGKPKAKLKKEVLEGFYIEEKKEGQPHLRQIAAYDDPAIIEWLGKNWEASFSIQQAWLNNNKSAVWKLWQTFFETNKMQYRDTWAGLHSHFCRYLKKASQREFEAKPQKPIKPPVESNRPEEPRRRQTPEERDAAIKAAIEKLRQEEEEEKAKKAAKLAQEQQLKDELNKILPNG